MQKHFAIAAVLVIALALINLVQSNDPSADLGLQEQVGVVTLVPSDLTADKLEKFVITPGDAPDKAITMIKDSGKWKITSHFNAPVDPEKITNFVNKLVGIQGDLRTENPEVLEDFKVNDAAALSLQFYKTSGEPTVELLLGKKEDQSNTFVRLKGENKVYSVGINVSYDLGMYSETDKPKAKNFINTSVFTANKDDITKVAITWPDKSAIWQKVETPAPAPEKKEGEENTAIEPAKPTISWKLIDGGIKGKTIKDNVIDGILNNLTTVKGIDVVDPSKKADYGLDKPAFRAVLTLKDGTSKTLVAGRPTLDGDCFVQDLASEHIYEFGSYTFENIFRKGKDLYDLSAFTTDKASISAIDITDGTSKGMLKKGKDGKWMLSHEVNDKVFDDSKVDGLLSNIASITPEDFATSAGNGMKNPSLTLTVKGTKDNNAFSHQLVFGNTSPMVDGHYTTINGSPLVTVTKADVVTSFKLNSLLKDKPQPKATTPNDTATPDVKADKENK